MVMILIVLLEKIRIEDLVLYLETNAKDFIQFKASLLMDKAQNDPIKRLI